MSLLPPQPETNESETTLSCCVAHWQGGGGPSSAPTAIPCQLCVQLNQEQIWLKNLSLFFLFSPLLLHSEGSTFVASRKMNNLVERHLCENVVGFGAWRSSKLFHKCSRVPPKEGLKSYFISSFFFVISCAVFSPHLIQENAIFTLHMLPQTIRVKPSQGLCL